MSTNRPSASAFDGCRKAKLTGEDKVNLAMAIYLTLETLNDMAPRGCDGAPCDLMVDHGGGEVSIQKLLTQVLGALRAPVPPIPEAEDEAECECCKQETHEWH